MTGSGKRIEAVDILRGFTMACMILVNNPGDWGHIYAPLRHADWNGLTPTDCIFPVFLFLMGFSIFLSLRKQDFRLSGALGWKIVKRTVLLFGIGFLLSLPSGLMSGNIRIMGVLQRFALCYLAASLLVCLVGRKWLGWIAAGILAAYALLLALGHGFSMEADNVIGLTDRALLGERHIYNEHGLDPEGILSTIPSIAHTLIGFCTASLLLGSGSREKGLLRLLVLGSTLLLGGLLLQYGCPLNKKVWSPTFVLVTCGIGALLLGLLTWFVDERKTLRHSGFWKVFGTNSILCYILSFVFSYVLGYTPLGSGLYAGLSALCGGPGELPSLLYALCNVLLVWLLVLPLYRRRIFIKL